MNIKFPVKAIQDQEEDGKPVMPEAGDMVSLPEAMAVVKSVDGDTVTVEMKSVGGCECDHCDDKEEAAKEGEAEPTEESVMKMAKKMDEE